MFFIEGVRLFTVDSGQRDEDDVSIKLYAALRFVTLCHIVVRDVPGLAS